MSGIDIQDVKRVEEFIQNKDNAKRIFFEEELDYAYKRKSPAMHLAGFFCVKESVVKAVGQGVISEIKVLHYENGMPYVEVFGKIKELIGNNKIDISISHTNDYACAVCQIKEM